MLIHGEFNQVSQIISDIESLGDICDDLISLNLAMIKYELLLQQNNVEFAVNVSTFNQYFNISVI